MSKKISSEQVVLKYIIVTFATRLNELDNEIAEKVKKVEDNKFDLFLVQLELIITFATRLNEQE